MELTTRRRAGSATSSPGAARGSETILLVEDEDEVRELRRADAAALGLHGPRYMSGYTDEALGRHGVLEPEVREVLDA